MHICTPCQFDFGLVLVLSWNHIRKLFYLIYFISDKVKWHTWCKVNMLDSLTFRRWYSVRPLAILRLHHHSGAEDGGQPRLHPVQPGGQLQAQLRLTGGHWWPQPTGHVSEQILGKLCLVTNGTIISSRYSRSKFNLRCLFSIFRNRMTLQWRSTGSIWRGTRARQCAGNLLPERHVAWSSLRDILAVTRTMLTVPGPSLWIRTRRSSFTSPCSTLKLIHTAIMKDLVSFISTP